jgi:hypothetical protein
MKKQLRKLNLCRETVRGLTSSETREANGGATLPVSVCGCQITAATCTGLTHCDC